MEVEQRNSRSVDNFVATGFEIRVKQKVENSQAFTKELGFCCGTIEKEKGESASQTETKSTTETDAETERKSV